MSISAPFPYTYKEEYETGTCVFKLWFGSRYFIFKGLNFKTTVENLSKQIHRERTRPKDDSILTSVIAYINKARVTSMVVEKVCEADAIAVLLMEEYEALQEAKNDPNCLNTRFTNTDYYPHWVPQVAINEFTKQLQGPVMSHKEKNLKRFLSKYIKNQEHLQEIMGYIGERFK